MGGRGDSRSRYGCKIRQTNRNCEHLKRSNIYNIHRTTESRIMSLPKGFKFLPVTAGLSICLVGVPIFISIIDWKPYFMFAWDPFIVQWNQFWRIPILQLQFQNQSEVTLGVVITILKLKGLERVFGSLKFFKIIILLYIYNLLLLTLVSFTLYQTIGWNLFLPAGPFGIIYGFYFPYIKYIPDTYLAEFDFSSVAKFKPLGETLSISITDKFGSHLLYLLLFFSEGIPSMVVCLIGYFIGYLYFHDLVPVSDSSLKFLDPLYYKLTHEKKYEIGNTRREDNALPSSFNNEANNTESQAVDLAADDDANGMSREDSPDTPPRSFGQQMLDTFRR